MRKVKITRFRDYPFEYGFGVGVRNLFIHNADFLYTKPLFIVCMVVLLIISIFKIEALSLFAVLLGLYFYSLQISHKLRRSINIKRVVKDKSKEEQDEEITYLFSNPYNIDFYNLMFFDQFDGSSDANRRTHYHYYFSKFEKNRRKKIVKKINLNNGMGAKEIGPLQLQFQDALGIHKLTYTDSRPKVMQVFPKVFPTNAPDIHAFWESVQFGLYDTHKRGENVNFYGAREYLAGDNVKKINWKLSLKGQKLIVNEFENNTNSNIEIVVIDDARIHVGVGSHSTFEYCKDFALSLFHSQILTHNQVGFHCYQKNIKPNSGKKHLNAMELMVAKLELKNFNIGSIYNKRNKTPTEVIEFKKKLKTITTDDSNYFIFTAIQPGLLWKHYLDCFRILAHKAKSIHLIVVDGLEHAINEMPAQERGLLTQFYQDLPRELNDLEIFCKEHNIRLYYEKIDAKKTYRETIRDVYKV